MGGGNSSPTGFNSEQFDERTSESLGSSITAGIMNAAYKGVTTVTNTAAPSGEIPHSGRDSAFSDSSLVDPSDAEVIEAGAPAVVDTGDGEVVGVVNSASGGGEIDIAQPDGTVETIPTSGDDVTVKAVGDPSQMNGEELRQYARDKVAVSPEFINVSDEKYAGIVNTAQNKIIDNIQDPQVAVDMADSVKTVSSGFDGASFCRTDGSGRADMGISSRASADTIVHEHGHAIAATYGFDDGGTLRGRFTSQKATPSEVAGETSTDMPDFGGEYEFGETTVEFDEFLLQDQSGYTPGETAANIERAVAHASPSELVSDDVSAGYDAQESVVESLSSSDVIEYEDAKGYTNVGMVTGTETDVGDEGYTMVTVQNFYDSDGNALSGPERGNPATGAVAVNSEKGEVAGEVHSVVDKEATAEGRGVDTTSTAPGETDAPESVTEFVGAVNKHWAKTAAHKEAGRDALADKLRVKEGYSAANTHETMAAAVESSQTDQSRKWRGAVEASPELMEATSNVVESSDDVQEYMANR